MVGPACTGCATRAVLLAGVVALAVGLRSGPARGDDGRSAEEARKLFEAGRQAYDAGQFVLAISLFEEAHELAARPSVVFALGQAYRRQHLVDGDPARLATAIDFYRRYLAAAPQGDRRDEALRRIGELELVRAASPAPPGAAGPPTTAPAAPRPDRTQLVVFSPAGGALAAIDGGPPLLVPAAVEVAPGPHRIRVEAAGFFPAEVDGVAVEGRLVPIEVRLREKPGLLTIRAEPRTEVEIDGRRMGRAPFAAPLELHAGRHFVALGRRGHRPATRELTLAPGGAAAVEARLTPTTSRRIAPWVLGTAGVLLAAGGVSSGLARAAAGDADAADRIARGQVITVEEMRRHNDAVARFEDLRTASWALYGGAAALGIGAALLYLLDDPRLPPPREASPGAPGWAGTF